MNRISGTSETVTNGIRIRVQPEFLIDQSDPDHGMWVHAYHVTISNEGDVPVQLVARHWIITNARGEVEHVRGPGVVGHQPVLKPGESFRYSSGCPMNTPVGTMHGDYQMVREDGLKFRAEVAPFTLSEPYAVN